MNRNLKKHLDELVLAFETPDFVGNDPVQFPHRFKDSSKDAEISGLIASSLAFGKREKIIEAVEKIHTIIQNEPRNFCENYTEKDRGIFKDFKYRYIKGEDISNLFDGIAKVLKSHNSLEELFLAHYSPDHENVKEGLIGFVGELLTCDNYLLPCPTKKSACKRLNLYLKWMIRKPPVDLGLWNDVDASKLIIPLDVHVAKVSRHLGILNRKANDWQSAYEITQQLKELDPNDPTKYDFALFGEGIGL